MATVALQKMRHACGRKREYRLVPLIPAVDPLRAFAPSGQLTALQRFQIQTAHACEPLIRPALECSTRFE